MFYDNFFRALPDDFNKKKLEDDYYARLYAAIDDAAHHVENNNTDGALMMIGTIRELAEAITELKKLDNE